MTNAVGIALQQAFAGLVAGRVYPIVLADEPDYPCIRYAVIATNFFNTLYGPSNLTDNRYRIDIFATTAMECGQIAASVLSIMRGSSFAYQNVPLMNMDGYEPTIGIFRKTLDFQVWEAEAMT
jgi:hypothetical protein